MSAGEGARAEGERGARRDRDPHRARHARRTARVDLFGKVRVAAVVDKRADGKLNLRVLKRQ